jgi:hypothetical protein
MNTTTGSWDNPGRTGRGVIEHFTGGGRPKPVWFLEQRYYVGRSPAARSDICVGRAQALHGFDARLADTDQPPYSPWDVTRRLVVVGPDLHERHGDDDAQLYIPPADDVDDPLLHWNVALREVLGDDYDLIAHGPRVAAALES